MQHPVQDLCAFNGIIIHEDLVLIHHNRTNMIEVALIFICMFPIIYLLTLCGLPVIRLIKFLLQL